MKKPTWWLAGAAAAVAATLGACASGGDDGGGCARSEACPRGLVCVGLACVQPARDAAPRLDQGGIPIGDAESERRDAAPVDAAPSTDIAPVTDAAGAPDTASTDSATADVLVEDAAIADATPDAAPDASAPRAVGEVRACGVTRGRCRAGRQRCVAEGAWGPCEGEVGPSDEVCNGADDDCNGVTDDGFEVGGACDGVGACGAGAVECRNDRLTRCSTDPGGSRAGDVAEACNGQDDDCAGRVDEAFMVGRGCDGRCGAGRLECSAGAVLVCSTDPGGTAYAPSDERCDGADDDCDGRVDEGFDVGAACDGVGACGAGTRECAADGAARCSTDFGGSADASGPERCDGADDDCDGVADEDFTVGVACEGVGACGAGRTECGADGRLVCSTDPGGSMTGARAEACNRADDDCDGRVDEGTGVGAGCPAVGACGAGVLECAADGRAVCSTAPGASADESAPEACNGVDDDCDGRSDEGFGVGSACDGVGACGAGVVECDGAAARCSTDVGGTADASAPEACNGVDDDCDGAVDDGGACGGDTCLTAPVLAFDAAAVGNTAALADDYSRSACLGASPGPDQVFRIDAPASGRYVIGVAPLDAAMDALFWVNADCSQPESCVLNGGRDLFGAGRPEARAVSVPRAGTYHVMVDGRVFGQGGPFLVTARPQADGEDCGRAVPLNVPGRFVGTTEERVSDIASQQCSGGAGLSGGPDQVFRLEPPRAGRMTPTLTPGPANLRYVLSLTTNCGAVDMGCVGSAVSARAGDGVTLAVDVEAGVTYWLVVDHPGQPGGSFLLDVTFR